MEDKLKGQPQGPMHRGKPIKIGGKPPRVKEITREEFEKWQKSQAGDGRGGAKP
jgi:hypothetical protein